MSYVKHLVSKKKKRFIEDGFDLDLAYIKPNIVAMGFPSENMEGLYRNNLDDVLRFLEMKHKDKYKIYNLCSERVYSPEKFNKRVERFPFDDHNAPPFELMEPFCNNMKQWLSADINNVAIVHCKAGKGRTGVMICAYLLYIGMHKDADEAMEYYAEARTTNKKGVTIPSQRRYVKYFAEYVNEKLTYKEEALLLNSITFVGIPTFNSGTCSPFYIIYQKQNVLEKSKKPYEVSKVSTEFTIKFLNPIPICGDVKIDFFHKDFIKKERMFVFWVNTFFLQQGMNCACTEEKPNGDLMAMFEFNKSELDKANKDKKHKLFPESFKVRLNVTMSGDSNTKPLKDFIDGKIYSNTRKRSEDPNEVCSASATATKSANNSNANKKETLQTLSKQHKASKDFTDEPIKISATSRKPKSKNMNNKTPSSSSIVGMETNKKQQPDRLPVTSLSEESNKKNPSPRCQRVEEFVNVPQSPASPSPTNSLDRNLTRSIEDITLGEEPLSDDDEEEDDMTQLQFIQSTRV